MAVESFSTEGDDIQLWRWLTANGTVNPNETPPLVRTTTGSSAVAAGTPTHAADVTVDATAGGVTVLAANTSRKKAVIENTGAANIRVSVGGTPTTTTGLQLLPGASLVIEGNAEFKCPTGAVKAIREGGTSSTAAPLEIA